VRDCRGPHHGRRVGPALQELGASAAEAVVVAVQPATLVDGTVVEFLDDDGSGRAESFAF
jgi:hypothetical protein